MHQSRLENNLPLIDSSQDFGKGMTNIRSPSPAALTPIRDNSAAAVIHLQGSRKKLSTVSYLKKESQHSSTHKITFQLNSVERKNEMSTQLESKEDENIYSIHTNYNSGFGEVDSHATMRQSKSALN